MRMWVILAGVLLGGCGSQCGGQPERSSEGGDLAQPAAPVPAEAAPAAAEPSASAPAAGAAAADPAWPPYPDAVRGLIEETVEGDAYTAKVQAAWGPVEVTGPATGAGGAASRYWSAFSTGDLDAVLAYSAPLLRDQLASLDSEAGRVEFRQGIVGRMDGNPMVSAHVAVAPPEPGATVAEGLAVTVREDGTEERRALRLVRDPESGVWAVEKVSLQR